MANQIHFKYSIHPDADPVAVAAAHAAAHEITKLRKDFGDDPAVFCFEISKYGEPYAWPMPAEDGRGFDYEDVTNPGFVMWQEGQSFNLTEQFRCLPTPQAGRWELYSSEGPDQVWIDFEDGVA